MISSIGLVTYQSLLSHFAGQPTKAVNGRAGTLSGTALRDGKGVALVARAAGCTNAKRAGAAQVLRRATLSDTCSTDGSATDGAVVLALFGHAHGLSSATFNRTGNGKIRFSAKALAWTYLTG